MRKTKEEAEITREKLLDAALAIFSRKGYASTTLNDIAAEANVTRGAIYWHFGGKAELYSALVQERFTRVNTAVADIFQSDNSPLEKLRLLMIYTMEYVEVDPESRAVLELTLFKTEVIGEMEEMMQLKKDANSMMVDEVVKLLDEGKAMGQFRVDLDSRATAIAIYGLAGGVVSLWLMNPGSFKITEQAKTIVDTFLRGIVK